MVIAETAFDAFDAAPVAEGVPWPWYAAAVAGGVALVAYLARLFVLPVQQAQSGKWVPRSTVDLLLQGKDDEIAAKNQELGRREKEIERLWALQHITDAAREELAKSVAASTDAIEANTEAMSTMAKAFEALPKAAEATANAQRQR